MMSTFAVGPLLPSTGTDGISFSDYGYIKFLSDFNSALTERTVSDRLDTAYGWKTFLPYSLCFSRLWSKYVPLDLKILRGAPLDTALVFGSVVIG
jgi:hypothetical protein